MVNDKDIQNLREIGLTQGEAKVYLALTKIGTSSVGPIVKKSGVAYSNVYDILNRLIEKGIVSFVKKSKTKYFSAANPKNLSDYLNKKEKEINKQKNVLKEMLPRLNKLQKIKQGQEAEVFVGLKGLKTAYERLFNYAGGEEELFSYIHEEGYSEITDKFFLQLTGYLKYSNSYGVCNKEFKNSRFVKEYYSKRKTKMKIRYVDFPMSGNLDVTKDMTLIVSWKHPIIGVLIKSQSIAENYKNYIKSMWKVAKE